MTAAVALLSSTVLWLTTGLIALQSWLQLGNVWVLYLLVAVQSGAQAINQPARSAILPMLIRKELLPAANALSMMSFGLAMTAGPLLAGVLVAWIGFGWTYALDFASFAFVLWAVYRLPPLPPSGTRSRAGVRSVIEGFRFLGTRPNLRMTFVIDLIAMILAQPRALMPAVGAVMIAAVKRQWVCCWLQPPLAHSWPGCFRAAGWCPVAGECCGPLRHGLGCIHGGFWDGGAPGRACP
jgi:ENTS family enterobactin (siderophore) exporter